MTNGKSDADANHIKYPYLLKDIAAAVPDHIWGTDITYIRLNKDFCYLVALLDWYSRYVISWALSLTLEIGFCLENLRKRLETSQPQIHNSDQGSHFTSSQYTDILAAKGIQISMDGRGRCMDNIFTERLWRTVKYEEVYLHDYSGYSEAHDSLSNYFQTYNYKRLHQSLNYCELRNSANAHFWPAELADAQTVLGSKMRFPSFRIHSFVI